jgi:hypothetical protein
MKLYIVHGSEVRRERASADEIADFVAGRNYHNEQLATVRIDDGDIIATPLTPDEIKELAAYLEHEQIEALRECMTLALKIHRIGSQVSGFQFSSPVLMWPARAPWAEAVMRAWAVENGLDIQDESPPSDPNVQYWIRTMRIRAGRYDGEIARMQWDAVNVGDVLIAIKGMCVGIATAFGRPLMAKDARAPRESAESAESAEYMEPF